MPEQNTYKQRRERIYDWMARGNITMVMLEDAEGRRDSNIRWLSGQPGDALLFLSVERKSLLVPWDINLAKIYADADHIFAYADFDRMPIKACRKAADFFRLPADSKIELPPETSYPRFLKFIEALGEFDLLCRDEGVSPELEKLRSVKDDAEIDLYRGAAAVTDELIDALEKLLRQGKLKTETDAAVFIETESRKRGCEGTGFETLAAGPSRSFAIHAFPAYSGERFGGKGLSILDFGLACSGYTTDVTLTVARDLSKAQEKLLALVEKAHKLALSKLKPGTPAADVASAVDAVFAKAGRAMPHALGHGIGLDPHEGPAMRNRNDNHWVIEPGMVIAVEPGLYDPLLGGCRLENDVLITENGVEPLTHSRIIRL
ncbi:MAG: Xaa-Pro peptidase family protein [Treponema sp.]|jgi:Xaa-Pro dipeptidase|nr:Xaa-Pro peptidase family protein [Treponema sp.]